MTSLSTRALISRVRAAVQQQSSAASLAYLIDHRTVYGSFQDIDELVWSLDDEDPEARDVIVHHLSVLRRAVLEALWEHDVFLGASVVADLLFLFLKDVSCDDPVTAAIRFARERGLHKPGLVIYPAHASGLHGFGFLRVVAKARAALHIAQNEMVLLSQANSFTSGHTETSTRLGDCWRSRPRYRGT